MACEECNRNCILLHRKRRDLSSSVTRFAKILLGDDILDSLCLPPKFAKTVPDLVGRHCKLEDINGAQWTVTLSIHNGFLSFDNGWRKFAVDHSLQVGEILVFNYIKKGYFVVQIYESTCTERTHFSRNFHPVKLANASKKIASKAIPSSRHGISEINSGRVGQPHKKARLSRNAQERTMSDWIGGDHRSTDTSATNQEYPGTGIPTDLNLEKDLNHPSKDDSLEPKFCTEVLPCQDNAFCVIIDRDACFAESEKRTDLYDLSMFEVQKGEHCAGKGCIGGEGVQTNAETNAKSSTVERNNTVTEFIGCVTASKVVNAGTIQNMNDFRHMDSLPNECEALLSNRFSSGFPHSGKLADNCRTCACLSNARNPYQKAKQSNENSSNCCHAQLPNQDASDGPVSGEGQGEGLAVHSMDAHDAIKLVKKEQVEWQEEASDHTQWFQDAGLRPTMVKEGDSLNSSFKRKAVEMEPDYFLTLTASISCLAVTAKPDFLELPTCLPFITLRKGTTERKCCLVLQDPRGKRWPAIYYERFGLFGLITGWKRFNEENKIQPGDHYAFSLLDESHPVYKVDVGRM